MDSLSLFSVSLSLFLLMDPIGNIPFFVSYLKGFEPAKARYIIFREKVIALVIIVGFNFIGDGLMRFLNIQDDTIQIAGGVILFLLCLKMVFPPPHANGEHLPQAAEPFIVPLAVPLVAGPGVLAAVMIYARQETNDWLMVGAIFLAWSASLLILISSAWIKKILGNRGIIAMERLMGLILTLIAVQMFLSGLYTFMHRP
jgi:multiple antibiotic resistance protein